MNVRSMLDCWAALTIKRAGGDADAPTLDSALGVEECRHDRVTAFEAMMLGWSAADERKELYEDEAVSLAVAQSALAILKDMIEENAPKGSGRPTRDGASVAPIGRKGPSPVVALAALCDGLMRRYCGEEGIGHGRLTESVLRCHPRKGRYSGMVSDRKKWHAYRSDVRHRRTVDRFIRWADSELKAEGPTKFDAECSNLRDFPAGSKRIMD